MTIRANLQQVARRLGPLLERAVFVGGATAELLITDRSASPVRPTEDVDLIVSVSSRLEYLRDITDALRKAGFKPDMREGAPVCRWVVDEVTVDVMPTDESVLGFSNRWYAEAVVHATWQDLGAGQLARVLTAPYFLATKFEAFKGRGRGDFLGSADVEDVIAIADGRPELLEEVHAASASVRGYSTSGRARRSASTAFSANSSGVRWCTHAAFVHRQGCPLRVGRPHGSREPHRESKA